MFVFKCNIKRHDHVVSMPIGGRGELPTSGKEWNYEEERVRWFKLVGQNAAIVSIVTAKTKTNVLLTLICGCSLWTGWRVCTAEPVWVTPNSSSLSRKRWACLFCLCTWMVMMVIILPASFSSVTMAAMSSFWNTCKQTTHSWCKCIGSRPFMASVCEDWSYCLCVWLCVQTLPEVLDSHSVRVQVKACGLSQLDVKVVQGFSINNTYIYE